MNSLRKQTRRRMSVVSLTWGEKTGASAMSMLTGSVSEERAEKTEMLVGCWKFLVRKMSRIPEICLWLLMDRSSSLSSLRFICLSFHVKCLAVKSPAIMVKTRQLYRKTLSIFSSVSFGTGLL